MKRIAWALSPMLLSCLVAGGVLAEWNAERALTRARELETTLAGVLEAAQRAPRQETTFQQRTRDAAVASMAHVHEASGELAQRLGEGAGREETELLFAQLERAFEGSLDTAREAVPQPEVAPLLERARDLIREMKGLYTAP